MDQDVTTVTSGAENTSPSTSSVEPTQTENSGAVSNDSTSEVVNTPEDNQQNQDVSSDGLSPKSQERFQNLANQLRDAQEQLSQYEINQRTLNNSGYNSPQPVQQPANAHGAQQNDSQVGILSAKVQLMEERQKLDEQKQLFASAEKQFPEMDPKSDKYVKEFDDAVTALYGKGLDPIDAAKQVRKMIEKATSRAVADENISIENKRAVSPSNAKVSGSNNQTSDAKRSMNQALKNYQATNNPKYLSEYRQWKREVGSN